MLHVDTADRRDLTNIGRIDLENIRLAFLHGWRFMQLLVSRWPAIVYVPIAQNTLGYLRDLFFLLPASLLRKKTIVHFHGADFQGFYRRSSKLMQALIRVSLSSARRIIVLGEGLRTQFTDFLPMEQIVAVPNGIPDLFASADQRPDKSGEVNVLFLSNLMREKGLFVVLEAARFVVSQEPRACFTLAGAWFRDDDRLAAEKLVQELSLTDYVRFLGVVTGDAKRQALAGSRLLVFPPVAPEGFGLVILEAMSAGLPVIATRQGAIPDVIVEGVTGYVVEPGDAAAIADRILCLLRDDDSRWRMGQAGRERFLCNYTLENCTTRLAEVFAQVLEEA
jgi:glycosyltransferase involved in cell wall biosynthesis